MNGIKLLLLLVASAQVEAGTERDYGWAVNKDDGILEYIVQINEDKKRAMEQRSVQYPNGRENVSNMPRELVGRAHRVVIRFGAEILPREPSLQELERTPRLYEQPNVSAAAVLGDRFRDLETPVRNIQSQGAGSVYPSMPNGLPGSGLSGVQGQGGGLLDQAGQTADLLRNDLNERLSDALPNSSMPGRSIPNPSMPDPSLLAQALPNQSGGASAFLEEARGGIGGAGSKFSNTAPAANSALGTGANPQPNTPTKLPDYPPITNTTPPFAANNQASTNTNNRNSGFTNGLGAGSTTSLPFPDRNAPLSNTLSNTPLPQQRTPSTTFGTSPGLTNRATNDWNTQTNPTSPNYPPSMSQQYDSYSYGAPLNSSSYQNPTHVASNPAPYVPPPNNTNLVGVPTNGVGNLSRKQIEQMDEALALREKFDKNKDGVLTPEEYSTASVDPIVLTLFVVSLLVNLYLGHLIRKLLMRYRLVLTNVRSQAAYT